jgi:nicotinate phosphoribosyltransferase
MVNFQTTVATKAARIVEAAAGRPVVEFGTRRAHTPFAGLYGARAAFIGGCAGTSNVEAGLLFNIPTYGTFAHSLTMAFGSEDRAFSEFADVFRDKSSLLIDTFDPLRGTEKAARMRQSVASVRIDSGDFLELTPKMRHILDHHGRPATKIMASGDLNEYKIEDFTRLGAPIDLYGVGTELITSQDAPALSGVYKLVEIERGGRRIYTAKFSKEKVTFPGNKQVFRYSDRSGQFQHDLIACAGEQPSAARDRRTPTAALLTCVMAKGQFCGDQENLLDAQSRCRSQLNLLPVSYRQLVDAPAYPVRHSARLRALLQTTKAGIRD